MYNPWNMNGGYYPPQQQMQPPPQPQWMASAQAQIPKAQAAANQQARLQERIGTLQEQYKGAGTEQQAGMQQRIDEMQAKLKAQQGTATGAQRENYGWRQERRQAKNAMAAGNDPTMAPQQKQPNAVRGGAQPEPAMMMGGGFGGQMNGMAQYFGQLPPGFGQSPQGGYGVGGMGMGGGMPQYGGMNFGGMPWGMPNMGGQRAWMQPQMMPQGGYNPQAGQQQGLAAPQGKMPAGTPVAPRPQQGGNTGSSPMPVGANGTSSHPGLIWWNGVEILDVGNYTDQWGNITTRDAYAQRRKDLAKFGPGGMLDGSMFKTKFGDLVQSSNGNSNIYKVNGGGENDLYHYDPQEGWKHMTADEYQKYGDYNYYNPLESQDAARAAGAQTYDYWMSGNGNATSAWNPNPRAGFAPDQWDKSR